jgi:hypothetical protein
MRNIIRIQIFLSHLVPYITWKMLRDFSISSYRINCTDFTICFLSRRSTWLPAARRLRWSVSHGCGSTRTAQSSDYTALLTWLPRLKTQKQESQQRTSSFQRTRPSLLASSSQNSTRPVVDKSFPSCTTPAAEPLTMSPSSVGTTPSSSAAWSLRLKSSVYRWITGKLLSTFSPLLTKIAGQASNGLHPTQLMIPVLLNHSLFEKFYRSLYNH